MTHTPPERLLPIPPAPPSTPKKGPCWTEVFSIPYPRTLKQMWVPKMTGKSLPNWNPPRSVSLSFAE